MLVTVTRLQRQAIAQEPEQPRSLNRLSNETDELSATALMEQVRCRRAATRAPDSWLGHLDADDFSEFFSEGCPSGRAGTLEIVRVRTAASQQLLPS
jgi:hypothetical protein